MVFRYAVRYFLAAVFFMLGFLAINTDVWAQTNDPDIYVEEEVDPDTVVTDPEGGTYSVNRLLVTLKSGLGRSDADALASSVDGRVIGYMGGNEYVLKVPATTITELDNIAYTLMLSNKIDSIARDLFIPLHFQ